MFPSAHSPEVGNTLAAAGDFAQRGEYPDQELSEFQARGSSYPKRDFILCNRSRAQLFQVKWLFLRHSGTYNCQLQGDELGWKGSIYNYCHSETTSY